YQLVNFSEFSPQPYPRQQNLHGSRQKRGFPNVMVAFKRKEKAGNLNLPPTDRERTTSMPGSPKSFFWYELMTTDMDAAEAFYSAVVGWNPQAMDGSAMTERYTVLHAGDRGVG